MTRKHMSVCPVCGNKRCPRAAHPLHPCSGSNAPGQVGVAFEHDAAWWELEAGLERARAEKAEVHAATLGAAYDALLKLRVVDGDSYESLARRCAGLEGELERANAEYARMYELCRESTWHEQMLLAEAKTRGHADVSIAVQDASLVVEVTTIRGQRLTFSPDEARDLCAQMRTFGVLRDAEANDLLRTLSAQAVAQVDAALRRLERDLAPMRGGR